MVQLIIQTDKDIRVSVVKTRGDPYERLLRDVMKFEVSDGDI